MLIGSSNFVSSCAGGWAFHIDRETIFIGSFLYSESISNVWVSASIVLLTKAVLNSGVVNTICSTAYKPKQSNAKTMHIHFHSSRFAFVASTKSEAEQFITGKKQNANILMNLNCGRCITYIYL